MAELVDALDSGSSEEIRKSSTLFMSTSDESVRTIRTLNININSIWVDFLFYKKIILLGKDGAYDKYYQARNNN